jgi:hypothetical protein
MVQLVSWGRKNLIMFENVHLVMKKKQFFLETQSSVTHTWQMNYIKQEAEKRQEQTKIESQQAVDELG